eukprot:scaffold21499_cov60-Attheya_sp.AAC.3
MLEHAMELIRRQKVSIVVNTGRPGIDQAVIVLTTSGGSISDYGLASSQLIRIRKAGIQLIICIDTVATSGGYMIASVFDKICAAPFARKYKRTIDIIGDVMEEGKEKLQEKVDDMHHHACQDHIGLA